MSKTSYTDLKETLLEGLEGNKRLVTEVCLDNAARYMEASRSGYMAEAASMGSTSAGNVAALPKVILPVIRRVMPTVICNEIIGVQPMTGPQGIVSTLRVRYAQNVPANGTGTIAGDEALSPYDLARYYSGNQNVAAPGPAPTAALEGSGGPKINIQLVNEYVTAMTRALSATWTDAAAQDMQSQYAIDIEAELMAILGQEIVSEIDQSILGSLRRLPGGASSTFDQSNVSGTATFVGDEHAALATLINRQANLIAQRTRRNAANWAVVSTTALTILQSATTSAFARTTEGTFSAPTNTKFVGTLNNNMKVYCDTYASDDTPVLIGYKGTESESDAAAIFCPYIPLMSSGVVRHPETFELAVSFQTRYGYVELKNSANSFGNAADYLGLIKIDASKLSFQ